MSARFNAVAASLLTGVLLLVIQVVPARPLLLAERFWQGAGWLQVVFFTIYAGWLAFKFSEANNALRLRPRIWLLFSLVFFAQIVMGLAGFEKMLMTGKLHLPIPALIIAGPLYRGGDFFMLILFTATVLVAGPAWCSHLCYIGAWDDLCSRSRNTIGELPVWWRRARIAMLMVVVVVTLLLRALNVATATALLFAGIFGLTGVAVMLGLSRKLGTMVHCTSFCPIGLLANWLGKISPWRMRIAAGCSGCMQCQKVCRYEALSRENILARRVGNSCTLCGDCVALCHSGQIGYRLPLLSSEKARAAFVTVITSLHAVFLAVARI